MSLSISKGVDIMPREGLIPIIAGTAVTGIGAVLKSKEMKGRVTPGNKMQPMVTSVLLGFGLAHVLLGAIDLVEHR